MKETALFVGWGHVHPGREKIALEGYHAWIEILGELKEKGEIDDFQTVLLGPHGGELDGFTLVYGDPIKLMEITGREDMHLLQLRADREFAKFSVIPAIVGERVEREFKLVEEEILPALEPVPAAVRPFSGASVQTLRVALAVPAAASALLRARSVAILPGLAVLGLVALAASAAATLPPDATRHPRVDAYYVAIGAAFVCYVVALALLSRARASLVAVLAVAVLVQAAPLARPLLLSQDAGIYWDYGRIAAVDGGNPYNDPPERFPHDPAYPFVAGAWRDTTSAYGPLFTAASEGGALVVGRSPTAARTLFKTAAAAGVVILALLVALVSLRPAFAAAAVGWNPLFAMHFGGGGHNDVWMMVPLVGALALDQRGRRHLAGALWAAAAAVKWIPLLLLPLRASVRQGGARFGYAGFTAAALAFAGIASILYGDEWLGAFGPVGHDVASGSGTSVPHLLGGTGIGSAPATAALVLSFGVAYAALLVVARRRRARLGLAVGLLLVATPWILPWYVSWTVPLAAAEDDAAALGLSLALTGYLLEARAPL